jgi:hypothetical protein
MLEFFRETDDVDRVERALLDAYATPDTEFLGDRCPAILPDLHRLVPGPDSRAIENAFITAFA